VNTTQTGILAAQASAPSAEDLERAADAARTAENLAGAASDAADRAFALIEGLPIEAHAIMAAALVSGVLLWLWGKALLKPAVGLLGVSIGAFTGLFLAPAFGVADVFGVPIWAVSIVAGGVAGLAVSLLTLKIAVVGLSSAAFGLAGLLGSIAYVSAAAPPAEPSPAAARQVEPAAQHGPSADPDGLTPRERVRRDIEALGYRLQTRPAERPEVTDPETGAPVDAESEFDEVLDHVRQVAATAWDYVRASFQSISPADRVMVAGSTLAGLGLGVVFGVLLPKRSTALVTTLAGSALWLTAAAWLAQLAPPPYDAVRPAFEHGPERWAIIWPSVAAVGLLLQFTGRRRRRRRRNHRRNTAADA